MCLLLFFFFFVALFLSQSVISFHAHLFITVYPPHHLLRTRSFFQSHSVAWRPWSSQSHSFPVITLHLYTLCYHFSQALLSHHLLASVFSSLPRGFIFTTEIRGHALNIFPPCRVAGRPPSQLCCVDTLIFCTVAWRNESMWIEERRGIVVWESMLVLIDVQCGLCDFSRCLGSTKKFTLFHKEKCFIWNANYIGRKSFNFFNIWSSSSKNLFQIEYTVHLQSIHIASLFRHCHSLITTVIAWNSSLSSKFRTLPHYDNVKKIFFWDFCKSITNRKLRIHIVAQAIGW